ncbi:MAG: glutamate decarboxylase [Clostridia bacterium]|nr:glutamate decarboxylase [Clostridia bacterium]
MGSAQSSLWRVIYIARGEQQAQQIEALLQQAGFMIERRQSLPGGARHEDIEIKALESEAEEARLYLMEQGL